MHSCNLAFWPIFVFSSFVLSISLTLVEQDMLLLFIYPYKEISYYQRTSNALATPHRRILYSLESTLNGPVAQKKMRPSNVSSGMGN